MPRCGPWQAWAAIRASAPRSRSRAAAQVGRSTDVRTAASRSTCATCRPWPAPCCSRPESARAPRIARGSSCQGAQVLEALDDVFGNLRLAVDLLPVDALGEEDAEALEQRLALLDRGRIELGLRMDEVEAEVAEEELLAE